MRLMGSEGPKLSSCGSYILAWFVVFPSQRSVVFPLQKIKSFFPFDDYMEMDFFSISFKTYVIICFLFLLLQLECYDVCVRLFM